MCVVGIAIVSSLSEAYRNNNNIYIAHTCECHANAKLYKRARGPEDNFRTTLIFVDSPLKVAATADALAERPYNIIISIVFLNFG